jgi:hypothetical protein
VNTLKCIILAAMTLVLSSCFYQAGVDPHRAEALAALSENGAGVLAIAAIPVHYYCDHLAWPSNQKMLDLKSSLLWNFNNLQYYHGLVGSYYARFSLPVHTANGQFTSEWHMRLRPPKPVILGPQHIDIMIISNQFKTKMPFSFEFECKPSLKKSKREK